jgi:hypothetical protein
LTLTILNGRAAGVLDNCSAMALHKPCADEVALSVRTIFSSDRGW